MHQNDVGTKLFFCISAIKTRVLSEGAVTCSGWQASLLSDHSDGLIKSLGAGKCDNLPDHRPENANSELISSC